MKVCGIIAEYNPFHLGHAYHFQKTRAILGQDTALVCVLSGNYVQRGEPALIDKYIRAEMAVHAGADLVIEMPLAAALSSAEDFAYGAISVLHALGSVEYLSFGSECGSATQLVQVAHCLNTPAIQQALHAALKTGISYAAALQNVAETLDPTLGSLLSQPNDTLGVAYCRALERQGSKITPLAIPRRGPIHDAAIPQEGFASASMLRQLLHTDRLTDCAPFMPAASFSLLQQEIQKGFAPASLTNRALLSQLRRLSAEDLAQYVRSEEGFHHRLYAAIRDGTNSQDIYMRAQTRRYPLARIRRALLRTYLNLPLNAPIDAQYLRVLAIGRKGRELLRQSAPSIPWISRPVHEKKLPSALWPSLHQDVLADSLYTLMLPAGCSLPGGEHFRRRPFCLCTQKSNTLFDKKQENTSP